ncbi:MAG: TetR/AcrR family transcriptional regulator [Schwartzia sp.]|nr:TetR/AcrR family transcriptional regulator [Schwartzia sp. (in: firmicutes)]
MAFDRAELLDRLAMALMANPGSTMQELADSAGISKASLHRIYSTKEKLQAIIVERVRQVFAEIRQAIRKPHEDYREALRELVAIHCRNSTYVLFVGRDDFFVMIPAQEWDAYYSDLEAFFREGQERGILTLDFSAGVMGDIFISLVTGLLECCLWGHLTERVRERTILRALLGGIRKQ